jgi:hypothetical protein
MRLSPLAIWPVLAACALVAVTSCSTDDPSTEPGLAPTMNPAVAAVSAYDIVRVSAMTIDGSLSEWGNIAAISMADNSGRTGGVDNTAKVKLAWDNTYLYAAYDVTDTELLAVQTTRDHADIYKDDEAELYIDPQGDGSAALKMTATDYHFLANVRDALGDNRGTTPPGGQDASYNAAGFLVKAVTSGTLNASGTDVGYKIEMRIAWTDLGVTPTAGQFMRIDPAVGDRDGSAATTEEFDWAGLTSFNNPSGWKDVQLVAPAWATQCLNRPGTTTTISGAQGTNQFDSRANPITGKVNATTASWLLTSTSNKYAIIWALNTGGCWSGGSVKSGWPEPPDATSWDFYHSSAGMNVLGASALVEALRVDRYGDAVRFTQPEDSNFTLRSSWFSNIHDDCIENDRLHAGLIDDVLFDGCYNAFSARAANAYQDSVDGSARTVTVKNSLVRLQRQTGVASGPSPSSAGFFKVENQLVSKNVHWVLQNNIFRADGPAGTGTLCLNQHSKFTATNNTIVWLGSGSYPCPDTLPSGWTLTTDPAVWDNAVASWKSSHPGLSP